MIHTVNGNCCCFVLLQYFSEHKLVETFKANNLQCVTGIGQLPPGP